MAKDYTKHTESTAPTDEQLEEALEFLEMVMEIGAPQNEWEQQAVQRLHDVVAKSLESTRANGTARQLEPPEDEASTQAAVGGGETFGGVDDEEEAELRRLSEMAGRQVAEEREAKQFMEERGMDTSATIPTMAEAMKAHEAQVSGASPAEPAAQEPGKPGAEGTSSPNWANGAVVGKNDAEAFIRSAESGNAEPVKMPEPAEPPKLNWQGLASRTDARGRYFDSDGRVITKRQAERMERKRRKELGLA